MKDDKFTYGPLFTNFRLKCQEAISFLLERKEGIATEVIYHPQLGYIDLPYGRPPSGKIKGYGLAKLIDKHPEVLNNLQEIVASTRIYFYDVKRNRYFLKSDKYEAVISLTWLEENHHWLLTAYEPNKKESSSIGSIFDIHNSNLFGDWGEYDKATSSENDSYNLESETDVSGTPERTSETTDLNTDKNTTNFNPNQEINLGSYDVLEHNTKTWDLKGFSPTYKILPSYDHLIDPAIVKTTIVTEDNCTIPLTIANIQHLIQKFSYQVRNLAAHLKGNNHEQSCFNIWHWIKTNIPYGHEPDEELRTPARTYYDSKQEHPVDCDDYAIMAACLLYEMYKPVAPDIRIVAFNNKPDYSHIYTMLKGIVVDGVMSVFNEHPKNITKHMKLSILEGIEGHDFSGFGEVTSSLIDKGKFLLQKFKKGNASPDEKKDLNKILYLLGHESEDTRKVFLGIMKHIDDIRDGKIIFKSEKINTLLKGIENISLGAIESLNSMELGAIPLLYEMSDNELAALDDIAGCLGKLHLKVPKVIKKLAKNVETVVTLPIKTLVNVVKATVIEPTKTIVNITEAAGKDIAKGHFKEIGKDAARYAKQAVKDEKSIIKTEVHDIGEGIKAVVAIVKVTNPLLLSMRASILLVLELNVGNISKMLSVGAGTLAEAQARDYTQTQYHEHVDVFKKAAKLFDNIGGEPETFVKAINNGKKHHPILPGKNAGVKGMGELGIATEAAVAESSGFIATVITWLKKLVLSKKDDPNGRGGIFEDVVDFVKDITPKNLKEKIFGPDKSTTPTPENLPGTSSGKTGTYVLIGLAVLVGGYFIFKK